MFQKPDLSVHGHRHAAIAAYRAASGVVFAKPKVIWLLEVPVKRLELACPRYQ